MPMMRIHFTSADLGRVQLKLGIDVGWEIINSVHMLAANGSGLWFDAWRIRVRERARQDMEFRAALRALSEVSALVPTIAGASSGFDTAPDALRVALGVYYRVAIHPQLPQINDALRVDSATRLHLYSREGAEALLTSLAPAATWDHPVLTFDHHRDRDLRLDGSGLLLIPGFFCSRPVMSPDPPRPTLVFPLSPFSHLPGERNGSGDRLGALIGPTRAMILRSVIAGTTSTDLARHSGVSAATVSHHTTVLRAAGLIITRRRGNSTTHLVTPLGLHLLGVSR